MISNIKIMLGEAAANFTDEQISLFYEMAKSEVEAYCRRTIDAELDYTAQKMAIVKLNRLNTEGLTNQSFSGTSEAYVDGYPAEIVAILNRKRKVKVL